VLFDRGGGGKQHADRLREMGYPVHTVGFGEGVVLEPRVGRNPLAVRKDQREEHYEFTNRRSQMYGELSQRLDPSNERGGFSLPPSERELRWQMSKIPKTYDGEGRLKLLPKSRTNTSGKEEGSLVALIGHSPDELDALVLAVHAMSYRRVQVTAGAVV
jgi:hypothetical protein